MIRPCSIAETMLAKLSSVRTMSAVSLDTSVPVMPIATPMFARLRAGASFTPSPVIATTWSRAFRASTIRVLCWGETRQHTWSLSARAASSSSLIFSISGPVSTRPPGVRTPISRAIASAVSLWSPVTMTLFSPAPLRDLHGLTTSGRAGSIMPSRPTKVRSFSIVSGVQVSGTLVQRTVGDAQHPQRVARQIAVLVEDLPALSVCQGNGLPRVLDVGAEIEQDVGRALDERDVRGIAEARGGALVAAALGPVDRRHPLAVGVERDLLDPGHRLFQLRRARSPAFAAATTMAPSVGSPTIRHDAPPGLVSRAPRASRHCTAAPPCRSTVASGVGRAGRTACRPRKTARSGL